MGEYSLDYYTCLAEEKIGRFQKFGSVLGLDRIRELLRRLDNPQETLSVIHVAGTNGKGSVCRFLYEILESAGYKTGLFTSPYLQTFHERIQYHGTCISDEALNQYTDTVTKAADEMVVDGFESPTEFEIITAIAMTYFAAKKPDFVILEVGLGGRGDSTNVIERPLVDIITSISYDHMDRLGDTLEKIAYEKAGIIKTGVPVVSMVPHDESLKEAAKVIAREAYEKKAIFYDASRYPIVMERSDKDGSVFSTRIEDVDFPHLAISMCGEHQVENALCALAAIEILRKSGIIKLDREQLDDGFLKARQPGRFEVFSIDDGVSEAASSSKMTMVVLDGAHNQDGMESLVKTVDDCFYGKRVLSVLAMLQDKAVDSMLDLALSLGEDFIATTPDNQRKLPAKDLAEKIQRKGKHCQVAEDAKDACILAMKQRQKYDVVVFAGSLYMIGKIRSLLEDDVL